MTEQAAGLLGSPILIPESDKFLHNQRLGLVTKKPGIPWTNEFFFHVFNTKAVRKAIHDSASGVKVRHTSPTKIGEIVVSYPTSIPRQREMVATLTELEAETDRLASIYQRKLAALEELRKSLLHQAFSGELTARSNIIAFPAIIPNISTTDLHAGILAIAYQAHEKVGRQTEFGHVKAEKIAHMIEAHVGIELGRTPVKDAAGPNDYPHLKIVESRARKAGYFQFNREADRYHVKKLGGFNRLVARTRERLASQAVAVDALIKIMLPLDTKQAEILSTTYAAWNNLLLNGVNPSDKDIVLEARENWHPDKLRIPRERFFKAIVWMREKNVTPAGKGKKVVIKR
jgi:hypothetical protein